MSTSALPLKIVFDGAGNPSGLGEFVVGQDHVPSSLLQLSGAGDVIALSSLKDTSNIEADALEGHVLTWNATLSRWTASANAIGGGGSDHGTLTGLDDDDHTQYTLQDGTRVQAKLDISSTLVTSGATDLIGEVNVSGHTTVDDILNVSSHMHVSGESYLSAVDIIHGADKADDHALEVDCFAQGFGDVKAVDVAYSTGDIAAGEDEACILVDIDESDSTGGDVAALEVLATDFGSSKNIGLEVFANIDPILHETGNFEAPLAASANASSIKTEIDSDSLNVELFGADNDTLLIGHDTDFEEIEFLFVTPASNPGIQPTFEYSTGVDTWATFTPVDGTNAMRNNGVIAWLKSDIPSWTTGIEGRYLIRITRTRNTLGTAPIEERIKVAQTVELTWNSEGEIFASSLNAYHNMTVSGASYFQGDIQTSGNFSPCTVEVCGTLGVSGATELSGTTLLGGQATAHDNINVSGDVITSGTGYFTSGLTIRQDASGPYPTVPTVCLTTTSDANKHDPSGITDNTNFSHAIHWNVQNHIDVEFYAHDDSTSSLGADTKINVKHPGLYEIQAGVAASAHENSPARILLEIQIYEEGLSDMNNKPTGRCWMRTTGDINHGTAVLTKVKRLSADTDLTVRSRYNSLNAGKVIPVDNESWFIVKRIGPHVDPP